MARLDLFDVGGALALRSSVLRFFSRLLGQVLKKIMAHEQPTAPDLQAWDVAGARQFLYLLRRAAQQLGAFV
jgi:hypothetical protein